MISPETCILVAAIAFAAGLFLGTWVTLHLVEKEDRENRRGARS